VKDKATKKELAQALALALRTINREKFEKLLDKEAGTDLVGFFTGYANMLLEGHTLDPESMHGVASSALAIGYLMGRLEDRGQIVVPKSTVLRALH
jgi:hypothetical protein